VKNKVIKNAFSKVQIQPVKVRRLFGRNGHVRHCTVCLQKHTILFSFVTPGLEKIMNMNENFRQYILENVDSTAEK